MSTPQHKLDQKIADLIAQAERLKTIRAAMDDDAVRAELQQIFGGLVAGAKRGASGSKKTRSGTYEKIREFFNMRGNEWATVTDMERAGIVKPTARQVLYKGKPHEFERISEPGGRRETKFRLKKSDAARENGKPRRSESQLTGDMGGVTIAEAATKILQERGNEPTHFRLLAAEAIKRGYKSNRADSTDKSVTQSFWATMRRNPDEFEAAGDGLYRLVAP